MFIWLAALGLLFVQPAYYRLKANGYPAQPYIPITIAIAGCCLLATSVYPLAIFGSLIASVGLYWFARTRHPKEGAPGNSYLQITFQCRYCHQQITFPRRREGRAVLCPKCRELIRVPV